VALWALGFICASVRARTGVYGSGSSLSAIPNTHLRGSRQIDFVLTTVGIAPFIRAIGLLDFDVAFQTDHRTFFIDIDMDGFFGSASEKLPAQRLRQLQLEDPRVATAYRKALHQRSIHHSVFQRMKEQSESSKCYVNSWKTSSKARTHSDADLDLMDTGLM
jgi:hypothetical protein